MYLFQDYILKNFAPREISSPINFLLQIDRYLRLSTNHQNQYHGDRFAGSQSMDEETLAQLEEERRNERQERLRMDLLLASSLSPESIRRIFNNTVKTVNGLVICNPDETESRDSMIKDAIKAEARTMRLADLRKFVKEFPELQFLLTNRLETFQT